MNKFLLLIIFTLAIKIVCAQTMVIENIKGPITANELKAFKAYMNAFKPSENNFGNAWVYGTSGSAMESLGRMYEATGDKEILDKMILLADKALSIRNNPTTGRILWNGKRELCWPNKQTSAPDSLYSGSENGDIVAHIAYCAKLIIQSKSLWDTPAAIGDPYSFGKTYKQRADKYLYEMDRTLDAYIIPNFVKKDSLRFYWPEENEWKMQGIRYAKDSGHPIPWNQQAMLTGAFQRMVECYELLDVQPKRITLYDKIVKASADWFISQLRIYKNSEGYECYKWSYPVNDPTGKYTEDTAHGAYDILGICRNYQRAKYHIPKDVMLRLANTVRYVIYNEHDASFAAKVDGTNGNKIARKSLGANYLLLTPYHPQLFNIIAAANLENAKNKMEDCSLILTLKQMTAHR